MATKVHNAWYKTIEDGIHTGDIYDEKFSTKRVGTKDFADAVIERVGQKPSKFKAVDYGSGGWKRFGDATFKPRVHEEKILVGADIFLDWEGAPEELAQTIKPAVVNGLNLKVIANRGVKVWPDGQPDIFCSDHWCLRFVGETPTYLTILGQLQALEGLGLDFVKVENLYTFNGKAGYTVAQGE